MAAATRKPKVTAPDHPGDACEVPRIERYNAPSAEGTVPVVRCQECGAHKTEA